MKNFYFLFFLMAIPGVSIFSQGSATCAAATVIVVNGGSCEYNQPCNDATFEATGAAFNNNICGTVENATQEIWYTFQAISSFATVSWRSGRAPAVQVFSGACGGLALIGCSNSTLGTLNPQTEIVNLSGLTVGTFYRVRIVNTNGVNIGAGANAGTLCITSPAANDEPCGATPLVISQTCSYSTYSNFGYTASVGIPPPGCGNYLGGDMWFSVTVPPSGNITFDTQTGTMLDGDIAIYSGACGALNLIACDDLSSANGVMGMITLTGQTPGATLYIRVWENGNNNNGTFGICAFDPAVPNFQDCNTAIGICNDANFMGLSNGVGVQELNATNQGCLAGNENQSMWFGFSPQATGTIELFINPTQGAVDYDFAIWGPYNSATCPVVGNPIRCSWAAAVGTTGLKIGSGDVSEGAGPNPTNRFVDPIIVGAAQVGKIYYLLVDNWSMDNTPFILDWDLTPPNMLDCTPALPVEMESFSGNAENEKNNIYWSTQTEMNSNYFILEKSKNAETYSELSRTKSAGNSNTLLQYSALDPSPYTLTYYRLQQVDFNGESKTYGPISVHNNHLPEMVLYNVYPNPAKDFFSIDLYSKELISTTVSIYNSFGLVVFSRIFEVNGSATFQIPSADWSAGIYFVKVTDDKNGFNELRKVIIR
jgi:hypothetical protein